MNPADILHAITTGPARRRRFLTPVGLAIFFGLLALVIWGGLLIDRAFSFPELLPGIPGTLIGIFLLLAGALLWARCIVLFLHALGTPVPFNPPQSLVVIGPYAWTRNPMLTGVFSCLFGLGFVLHSVGIAAIGTPAFLLLNALSLLSVEEPELERRFGTEYAEYKRRVPMFLPRFKGNRGQT